jgi:cytochrome c biogenesis protein CcdA
MVESGEGLGQIFLGHLIQYTVLGLEIIITIIIIIIGITQALLFKIMLSDSSEER